MAPLQEDILQGIITLSEQPKVGQPSEGDSKPLMLQIQFQYDLDDIFYNISQNKQHHCTDTMENLYLM